MGFSSHSPKHDSRRINYAKFALGVTLCMGVCMDSAQSSWDRLLINRNPDQDKGVAEDEWIMPKAFGISTTIKTIADKCNKELFKLFFLQLCTGFYFEVCMQSLWNNCTDLCVEGYEIENGSSKAYDWYMGLICVSFCRCGCSAYKGKAFLLSFG